MGTTGYSGTPLLKKLGFKTEMKVYLFGQPDNYFSLIGALPEDCIILDKPEGADLLHIFSTDKAEIEFMLPDLRRKMNENGMIWVSWPKKSAKIPTTLTEYIIRDIALQGDLVDVKVCAVDEKWSGLKLVIRKDRRGKFASI